MHKKILILIFVQCFQFIACFSLRQEDLFKVYSEVILEEEFDLITRYLKVRNKNFFFDDPMQHFPVKNTHFIHLLFSFTPLVDFFYPQNIDELVFPYSLEKIADSLSKVLRITDASSIDKIDSGDIVLVTNPSYEYLKELLTLISEQLGEKRKKVDIFIAVSKNKFSFPEKDYETFYENIKQDIEKIKNRPLLEEEIQYIKQNAMSEKGIVSVIKNFFPELNTKNIQLFDFQDNFFINDFLFFIDWNDIKSNKIIVVSPDPLGYLMYSHYLLEKKEMLLWEGNQNNIFFINFKTTTDFQDENKKKLNIKKLFVLCSCLNLMGDFCDYEVFEEGEF